MVNRRSFIASIIASVMALLPFGQKAEAKARLKFSKIWRKRADGTVESIRFDEIKIGDTFRKEEDSFWCVASSLPMSLPDGNMFVRVESVFVEPLGV